MTHVARARKARGAKLVVVDPYRTGTAQTADLHLMLRPGTDAALACAVMHVAFRDGHADCAFMARYADDPTALEAHVATRSPACAARIMGLTVKEPTITAEGQRREGRPTAMINPADATTRGVAEGALVRLGNGLGEVVLWALPTDRPTERAKPGTVIVGSLWPNTAFVDRIGINAVTSDEPAGPAGGAVLHDTAIWIRAEAANMALAAA